MASQTYYKDGYKATVSQSHAWRTAENSCDYMLSLIKHTDKILDVGCGPGTITFGLAKYVPEGEIIGIEPIVELIEEALRNKKTDSHNVKFQVESVFSLPFPDNYFDIVHAHQVVIHLSNPLEAIKEMKRVLKPDGYLCVRDAELRSTMFFPESYEDALCYYMDKIRTDHTTLYGGTRLKELALSTAFKDENINFTTSAWTISSREDRAWFSQMYIKRLDSLQFDERDKFDKETLQGAWEGWTKNNTSICILLHCEIVAKK